MNEVAVLSSLEAQLASRPSIHQDGSDIFEPLTEIRGVIQRPAFQITFYGKFNSGKSTLLNALCGTSVLPTSIMRATGVITKITHSPQPSARVVYGANGTTTEADVSLDDIARYVVLDVSTATSVSPHGVREVWIGLPIPWLKHCILVDTPGLLDNPVLTNTSVREVKRSDLVVMVLDAKQVLSEPERESALQIHSLLNGNLAFVVEKMDKIPVDDRDDVLEWTKSYVEGLEVGNELVGNSRVFALDSKAYLAQYQYDMPDGSYGAELTAFKQWLIDLVSGPRAEEVALTSRLGILSHHVTLIQERLRCQLELIEQQLDETGQADEQKHRSRVREFQAELTASREEIERLRIALKSHEDAFVKRCIRNVKRLISSNQQWSHEDKLKKCFETATAQYVKAINSDVQAANWATGLEVPPFSPGQSDVSVQAANGRAEEIGAYVGGVLGILAPGAWLIGGLIGAAVGGWIGRNLSGVDVKQQTIEKVEGVAKDMSLYLRTQAEVYLDDVQARLDLHQKEKEPTKTSSRQARALAKSVEKHKLAMEWCTDLNEGIAAVRNRVL